MKKAMVAVFLVILLASVLSVGCQGVVKGSGNLETKQFNFSDFTRCDIGNAFEVEIDQSSSYSVSITADDNLFEHIQVTKASETLKIGLKTLITLGPATLEAKISMPELRGLNLSGATRGTVTNFSSTENLDVGLSGASYLDLVGMSAGDATFNVSGASKVIGEITTGDADFHVSGASTVQLEGLANDIVVDGSGASRIKLAAFPVNNADVTLSGASNSSVSLEGRLDADLSGASKLEYSGEQIIMGTINTSGGSTLSKK